MEKNTDSTKNHHDNLFTLSQTKGFLGREFLTWLWFQTEAIEDKLTVPSSDLSGPLNTTFWIDDRIVMQPLDQNGHEHLMRGGSPSHSQEAATALASGKMVKELKVGVHIEGMGEFTAILSYHDLTPRSLQLPQPPDENKEEHSILALRVYQTQAFLKVLDNLFAMFLKERTAPQWERKTLAAIRQWMKNRLIKGKPVLH